MVLNREPRWLQLKPDCVRCEREHEWTQAYLAAQGVTRQTINSIEKGRYHPNLRPQGSVQNRPGLILDRVHWLGLSSWRWLLISDIGGDSSYSLRLINVLLAAQPSR